MKIKLQRLNEDVHFEAVNEAGVILHTDGSPEIGGENKGMRPMQLLLVAVASCSAIDIVGILKKQKQKIQDFSIEVDGEREVGKEPAIWKKIHLAYHISGEVEQYKLERAISLSLGTYCSVAKMLEKSAEITSSYSLNEK